MMTFPSALVLPIGGPGAGKGTVSRTLQKRFGFAHISTGDFFRSQVKEGTELGISIKETVESGELLPDSLVIEELENMLDNHRSGLVLDGFPRSIAQCRWLDERIQMSGAQFLPVHLQAPSQLLLERATNRRVCINCKRSHDSASPHFSGRCSDCGSELTRRPDDLENVVRRRLTVMERWLPSVLNFYAKLGLKEVTVAGSTSSELANRVAQMAASALSISTNHSGNV